MTVALTNVACYEPPSALARAQAGDPEAFREVIADHQSMVFSQACRFFNDRSQAEEVAQDVFLKLYRNLAGIESDSHLLFWLRQVTTHRCIDGLRRSRLRAVSLDDVGEIRANETPSDPLLDRKVRTLIAELPEMQKTIVTLRYQEDLDPSEISRIVNLPVNTVKSHLHRALQSLRKRLGDPKP